MTKGKAFGFFECTAPFIIVGEEIFCIKKINQLPQSLELLLMEGLRHLNDQHLAQRIREFLLKENPDILHCRYLLEVGYPNHSNKETANENAAILNQLYNTPLFEHEESFAGEIVYEENGICRFRD